MWENEYKMRRWKKDSEKEFHIRNSWIWMVILDKDNNTHVKCYVRREDLWAIRVFRYPYFDRAPL